VTLSGSRYPVDALEVAGSEPIVQKMLWPGGTTSVGSQTPDPTDRLRQQPTRPSPLTAFRMVRASW